MVAPLCVEITEMDFYRDSDVFYEEVYHLFIP
jgi:hypothetical protein